MKAFKSEIDLRNIEITAFNLQINY